MKKSHLFGMMCVCFVSLIFVATTSPAATISYDSVSKSASSKISNGVSLFTCDSAAVSDNNISPGADSVSITSTANCPNFLWTGAASYDLEAIDETGFSIVGTADAVSDLNTATFFISQSKSEFNINFILAETTDISITAGWTFTSFGSSGSGDRPNLSLRPQLGTTNLLNAILDIGPTSETVSGTVTTGETSGAITLGPGLYIFRASNLATVSQGTEGPNSSFGSSTFITSLGVSPVPIPAAIWLFGSGLIGLVGMARRKKA